MMEVEAMNDIYPLSCKIRLEPCLKNFTLKGSVEILLKTTRPMKEISLNAMDLNSFRCRVHQKDTVADCPSQVDPEK